MEDFSSCLKVCSIDDSILPRDHALFIASSIGDIIDENRGAFAGQVIANNYQWQGSGIEIQGSFSHMKSNALMQYL